MDSTTAEIQLPIDVVPGKTPPVFRWRQKVSTPTGDRVVYNEGMLPPNIEKAVADLITQAKRVMHDNAMLRGQVDSMSDKLQATTEPIKPANNSSSRKSKG